MLNKGDTVRITDPQHPHAGKVGTLSGKCIRSTPHSAPMAEIQFADSSGAFARIDQFQKDGE